MHTSNALGGVGALFHSFIKLALDVCVCVCVCVCVRLTTRLDALYQRQETTIPTELVARWATGFFWWALFRTERYFAPARNWTAIHNCPACSSVEAQTPATFSVIETTSSPLCFHAFSFSSEGETDIVVRIVWVESRSLWSDCKYEASTCVCSPYTVRVRFWSLVRWSSKESFSHIIYQSLFHFQIVGLYERSTEKFPTKYLLIHLKISYTVTTHSSSVNVFHCSHHRTYGCDRLPFLFLILDLFGYSLSLCGCGYIPSNVSSFHSVVNFVLELAIA